MFVNYGVPIFDAEGDFEAVVDYSIRLRAADLLAYRVNTRNGTLALNVSQRSNLAMTPTSSGWASG